MNAEQIDRIVRFDVRDALNETLWQRRSESLARGCAKAEARCRAAGTVSIVRVERIGNLTRERQVAVY